MLKPNDPGRLPIPGDERPVSDLVQKLIDDGKAYARAEVGLAKAVATAKVGAVKVPALLFAVALLLVIAAVNVLAVALFTALAPMVGPILAGLLAFAVFAALAGLLGWLGARKLREGLK